MKRIFCLIFGICFIFSCQRNVKEFDYLLEPQISHKPVQKMLVIEINDNPKKYRTIIRYEINRNVTE